MAETLNFEDRLRRLGRRHNRMYANGIVRKVGKDGLISAYPRRRLPRFPLVGFLILIAAAFLYKATLFAWLGEATYQERVDALASGSVMEQGGAWVMQADPATLFLSEMLKPLVAAE